MASIACAGLDGQLLSDNCIAFTYTDIHRDSALDEDGVEALRNDQGKRPAEFLDRDGVLNVDHGYTHRIERLEWIDGAPAAVRTLNRAGYYVIVVSNQAGVARGYYKEEAIDRFHAHMQEKLMEADAHVDAFYYCPHHPEGVIKEFTIRCDCRKPGTGLLEQAARDWAIDREHSFLIGDKDSDLAAAAAFNIRGIRFDAQACSLPDLIRKVLTGSAL